MVLFIVLVGFLFLQLLIWIFWTVVMPRKIRESVYVCVMHLTMCSHHNLHDITSWIFCGVVC
jgi:hypothetical protein